MNKNMVIGIAGGSGSGKTTLAKNIGKHFGNKISILRHDDYYKAQSDIPNRAIWKTAYAIEPFLFYKKICRQN